MTEDEAIKWFAELFGLPPASLSAQTKRSQIPTWDSLGVLTLMASLDETFNLVVDDATMRSLQSVGDVLALLRQHGKLT